MLNRRRVASSLVFGACLLFLASCSEQNLETAPSPSAPTTPGAVRIVDQAQFDELRASGRYLISSPLGTIGAAAGCASGSADAACLEAAHQRLRVLAVERGANLVLVLQSAVLQSHPPQLSLTGELYQLSER